MMLTRFVCLVLLLLPGAAPEDGFTPLFNGTDLTGWKVHGGKQSVWTVDNGLLVVQGKGGGWLMTEKEYADFELRLEYRLPKQGNSGVALRAPRMGDPAYEGMEIQILDDANYTGLKTSQHTGSIYDVVAASKRAGKPAGEWNDMRITANGPKITVVLNDSTIVDANLQDHQDRSKPDAEKKQRAHPGLLRKTGHVGLQSHDGRVEFRNLRIRVMESK